MLTVENIKSFKGVVDKEGIKLFAKQNHVKFSVTWFNEEIWLNTIIVPKKYRGKGLGKTLINMLKQVSDRKNIPIKLLAASCYGTELTKLKSYYKSLGFKVYKEMQHPESNDYMVYNA